MSLILTSVVFLLVIRTLGNGFVNLDDYLYLAAHQVSSGITMRGLAFAATSVSELYWRPLTWLAQEVNTQIYGSSPSGHHVTGVLLHAASAGLLFLALIRVGARFWFGTIGSLFWALHPLRVESFAWVAELKDVLAVFFFVAAILAYVGYGERQSRGRFVTWNVLGACSLMSKPVAVCLVPILMLLDYWPLRRTARLRRLAEKTPLISLSVAVMALTIYGQQMSGSMQHLARVPFLIRIENTPIFYVRYIGKMIWPVNLSCFYRYEQQPSAVRALACLLILTAITVFAVRLRKRKPWMIVGWLWFLIGLLPNIGLLQAGRQSIADRFTNLAMIGIAIAVAMALSEWAGANADRNRVALSAAAIALAALTVLTWRQIGYWHDSMNRN